MKSQNEKKVSLRKAAEKKKFSRQLASSKDHDVPVKVKNTGRAVYDPDAGQVELLPKNQNP